MSIEIYLELFLLVIKFNLNEKALQKYIVSCFKLKQIRKKSEKVPLEDESFRLLK